MPAVVTWAPGEEEGWATTIAEAGGDRAVMAPDTDLPGLVALLRRACCFVGSDTGPLHIAAALGVHCIGMYGPMPARRNGPYGTGHIALQEMELSGSSRERRNAPPTAMEAIGTASVCAAVDRLLAEDGAHRAC